MLCTFCTQYASKFGKLISGHRPGKGQFPFQSQRKPMPKNAQTTAQLHSSHMLLKCLKFSKPGISNTWTVNLQMFNLVLEKAEEPEIKLPSPIGSLRKQESSRKTFPSPMHESEKSKWSRSVVSDPQRPHGLQPSRLLHPWDFPGRSTGVGCHCLLHTSVWDECNCLSLGLEWKLTFSRPVATDEFSKFAGMLSAALSQHHLSGFERAQLEFHHLH